MTFYEQAREKLAKDKITGSKASAMAPAVKEALLNFAEQDEEFAQAIVQGGSFPDCMTAVAKGVGMSISDLEAYKKAVQFYFPGAEIRMQLTIDLVGDAAAAPAPEKKEPERKKPEGIVLDFTQFL